MATIRNYETLFIIKSDATEAKIAEVHKKNQAIIESFQGKVVNLDVWGKRKFAHPVNKETRGNYFHLMFTASTDCVAEMERNMRISDDVVRFISVRLEDEKEPMTLLAEFKARLAAHSKREQERAEKMAERNAERSSSRDRDHQQQDDQH